MTPLARALKIASEEAAAASGRQTDGMERVRLRTLAEVLQAEVNIEHRKVPPAQHLCGAQGFNPMLGDTCEGCEARKVPA